MWLFYYNCAGLHRGFAQLFGKKPENPRRTGPGLVSFPREACGRNRLREIPQFYWAVICLFSSSFSPGSIDFLPAVSYNEDRSFQNTLTTERTRLAAWGGAPRMLSQRTSSCLPVSVPPCDFLASSLAVRVRSRGAFLWERAVFLCLRRADSYCGGAGECFIIYNR